MSATWFRCDPSKLIGALSGMLPEHGYVYTMILMRIYEVGGPIDDDEYVLSRRTGYAVKKVADAIQWLLQRDKIQRLGTGLLDSRTTHEELSYREKLIKDAKNAGNSSVKRRIKVSFKKTQQNQQNKSTPVERPLNDMPTFVERPLVEEEVDIEIASAISIAQPQKRARIKTQISPDAQPTSSDCASSSEAGLGEDQFRTEWRKFRDHHRAKGNLMADWSAAWRTWLGNIAQFQPKSIGGKNGKLSVQDASRDLADRAARGLVDFGVLPPPYLPPGRSISQGRDSLVMLPEGGCGRSGDLRGGGGIGPVLLPGTDSLSGDGPQDGHSGQEPMVANGGRSQSSV